MAVTRAASGRQRKYPHNPATDRLRFIAVRGPQVSNDSHLAVSCRRKPQLTYVGGYVSFLDVQQAGVDPLLTFALSAVERQVTKYSGRSKRLLDAKSLAKAARHNI